MKLEYRAWCAVHVGTTAEDCYGRCAWATLAMQIAFPELIRVRGHYLCTLWGERDHWWLTTPEGEIIDPTAAQFPSKGHGEYLPWHEGDVEPTGMCPNCGESCYDGRTCCSDSCSSAYAAYCMNPDRY
jgi:hypothetical protein